MAVENKNIKKFYQQSPKPFNYVPSDLVEGYPQQPPAMSGLMRIDPVAGNIWVSAGNSQVTDWKLLTGGGGGSSISLQTNSVNNPVQNLLNLQEGTGIALTDQGNGMVTVRSTLAVPQIYMLGTDIIISADSKENILGILQFDTAFAKSYSFKATISYTVSDETIVGTIWGAYETGVGTYEGSAVCCQVWPSPTLESFPSLMVDIPLSSQIGGFMIETTNSGKANIATVEGVITNTKAGGTISIIGLGKVAGGFAGETVTILAGSTLVVHELP